MSRRLLPYIALLLALCAAPALAQLELTNVVFGIDLTGTPTRQTVKAVVTNKGVHPALTFQFFLQGEGELALLNTTFAGAHVVAKPTTPSTKDGFREFIVTLPTPLAPSETATATVQAVFTHLASPLPRTIAQDERQRLVYEGLMHLYSPYATVQTKTIVQLPAPGKLESSTEGGSLSNGRITYGPTPSVPAFSTSPLRVHYESAPALLVVEELARVVEVSHWGNNLAVEDHYRLFNAGASLKNSFSRLEYQQRLYSGAAESLPAMRRMSFVLPLDVTDTYYRDAIGNISTSNLRHNLATQTTSLDIQPRFPVFGGWHTAWYQGYNTPLSSFLGITAEGEYCLTFPLLAAPSNIAIDKFSLEVILPEGATNVQFHSAVPLEKEGIKRVATYLDVSGRVVFFGERTNLVNEHDVLVQVTYRLATVSLLLEPFLLFAFCFCSFAISMIYVRLDFALAKNVVRERQALLLRALRLHGEFMSLCNADSISADDAAATDLIAQVKSIVAEPSLPGANAANSAIQALAEAEAALLPLIAKSKKSAAGSAKSPVKGGAAAPNADVAAALAKAKQAEDRVAELSAKN